MAYKCRAYPTAEQATALNRTFGCVRVVWNRTLAWRHQRYDGEQQKTGLTQANAYLTAMKATRDLAWLNEVPSVPLQQAIRHQQIAFNFFAGRAKAKAARAHRKVRASRAVFLHRTSTALVLDHDVIVAEDLAVTNMIRNRSLAKAISDCGWGTFRAMLAYKAARYGRHLIVIDRWYPSSKTCSACGHLLAELNLNTRHWTCPSCGTRHDRDINAGKNIRAAGLAVSACGADVRPQGTPLRQSAAKQEPPDASPGIPVVHGRE